jgi:AraC-like DNA-binding protein
MKITTSTVDSSLGSWTYAEARPARLASVVQHLWYFVGRMAMPRERLFPGGYLEVILQLGPRHREVDSRGIATSEFPTACLAGLLTRPAVIEAPLGECRVLGIHLRPLAAYALFGPAVRDAHDQTVDLCDVSDATANLAEECYELASAEAVFEHVTQWIGGRLASVTSIPDGLVWATRRLEASNGTESIATLRDEIGMSRARFVDGFRQHTGLTPKRYGRMLRFRRALTMLQSATTVSQVALATGFFDQAHLNADFREFAEMTPREFMQARRYPGSVSVQEG